MDHPVAISRHGALFLPQYIGQASYIAAVMPASIDIPLHRFSRTPVLLLGGVNLIRSLGLAGIPVVVASFDPEEPAFASRYCVGRCHLPPDAGSAAIDAIIRIGDRLASLHGRRVPLMYGADGYLKLIYAHRERLQRYFLLMLNDPEVADALLVKDAFQSFAESRGLPVPRALAWDVVALEPGPVVVKPSNKVDWHHSPLRHRFHDAKALVFATGAEAAADAALAPYLAQLTCQQYVAGDDTCIWSFHGFADEHGTVLDSFIGRKLRTYPALTGESSFIELDDDDELAALGRDIAAGLPLKGVFKMDFKKDADTGRWYLLEINARFNLWHYLGACSGVNLLAVAYDYLVDGKRPLHPHRYVTDYRWLSLELDTRAWLDLRRRGELGFGAWIASLLFSRNVYNIFAWRDPGPWVDVWLRRFDRLGNQEPGRFLYRLRQWRSTAS
jgi:D-aspartate ligase